MVAACLLVMVVQDKGKSGHCSGISDHGRLGLISVGMCELVDSKLLRSLFEVVPEESRDASRKRL